MSDYSVFHVFPLLIFIIMMFIVLSTSVYTTSHVHIRRYGQYPSYQVPFRLDKGGYTVSSE